MSLPKVLGGKIPPKEHKKLITEDAANDVLERMIFAKRVDIQGARKDCLFLPHEMGPMWVRNPVEEDDLMFWDASEVNNPDLVWPMSVGVIFRNQAGNGWKTDYLHCIYAETVEARRLRGQYRFVGSRNIAVYEGFLERTSEWVSAVDYAAWHWGQWRDAGRIHYDGAFISNIRPEGGAPITTGHKVERGEMPIGERAGFAQSMALTYRYEWGAQFSIDGSARIIVPVTPDGALELFNDRNKPADSDRRAALRHWVSSHLRTQRGGDFSRVRSHLRGATSFNWRGFDVVIRPSQFDEEQSAAKTGKVKARLQEQRRAKQNQAVMRP